MARRSFTATVEDAGRIQAGGTPGRQQGSKHGGTGRNEAHPDDVEYSDLDRQLRDEVQAARQGIRLVPEVQAQADAEQRTEDGARGSEQQAFESEDAHDLPFRRPEGAEDGYFRSFLGNGEHEDVGDAHRRNENDQEHDRADEGALQLQLLDEAREQILPRSSQETVAAAQLRGAFRCPGRLGQAHVVTGDPPFLTEEVLQCRNRQVRTDVVDEFVPDPERSGHVEGPAPPADFTHLHLVTAEHAQLVQRQRIAEHQGAVTRQRLLLLPQHGKVQDGSFQLRINADQLCETLTATYSECGVGAAGDQRLTAQERSCRHHAVLSGERLQDECIFGDGAAVVTGQGHMRGGLQRAAQEFIYETVRE